MLSDLIEKLPHNEIVVNNFIKAWSIINNPNYKNIICTISGGSDSDIVLDICTKCDRENKIKYIWFNTGLEYEATKEHLKELELKYNITIEEYRGTPIPILTREKGEPFLSKKISDTIERLQIHNFTWSDEDFDTLYKKFPKCKAALRWWCNNWGDNSRFNISYYRGLKEYMILNPPTFKISAKCCDGAKKSVVHKVLKIYDVDLNIYGVRKSEGGARSTAYKNCYTINADVDEYRPIFYYTDEIKKEYEKICNINHSKCYTKYGLKRTGCAGCPFGRNFEEELKIMEEYEPKLYNMANVIFKNSYEYTRNYYKFREELKNV